MERLYSIDEAAKMLGGISPLTVVGWCARKRLAKTKVGRRTFISESELQRFLQESNRKPSESDAAVAA